MIFLTGDTHGEVFERIVKLRKQNKEDIKMQEPIYLIIMGDCGLVWDNDYVKTVKYIEKYISEHVPNLMILSVLGNHENYNLIYDLPKVSMFGNELFKVSNSIYFFENGYDYTIEDKTFAVFGGAFSIDRAYRKLDKSYWLQEIPSYEMECRLIETLDNNKCDYLLTHTTSFEEIRLFDKYPITDKVDDTVAHFLRFIKSQYSFKHHYFGHFHIGNTIDEINSTCLYKNVVKLVL